MTWTPGNRTEPAELRSALIHYFRFTELSTSSWLASSKWLWCVRNKPEYNSYEDMEVVTKMASGCALGTNNWGRIYIFVYQCIPRGSGVFLFLDSAADACEFGYSFRKILSLLKHAAPSHRLAASPTKHGAINLSPLMGTKGRCLIIHSECQTMLCRLLFRVGETHWIIQGRGFSFLEKRRGGSDVCASLIGMQEPSVTPEPTLAVTAAAAWVARRGGSDSCSSCICRPPPHCGRE